MQELLDFKRKMLKREREVIKRRVKRRGKIFWHAGRVVGVKRHTCSGLSVVILMPVYRPVRLGDPGVQEKEHETREIKVRWRIRAFPSPRYRLAKIGQKRAWFESYPLERIRGGAEQVDRRERERGLKIGSDPNSRVAYASSNYHRPGDLW